MSAEYIDSVIDGIANLFSEAARCIAVQVERAARSFSSIFTERNKSRKKCHVAICSKRKRQPHVKRSYIGRSL